MEENNEIIEFKENDDLKYYDLVIDINSFKDLYRNGWTVRASDEGFEKYEFYKKNIHNPVTVAAVIGNRNVGKSYLLQKLAKNKIPVGFSVDTKGLSVNYRDNFVILDTAGFESPILKNILYNITNKKKNNNEKENEENTKEDKKEKEDPEQIEKEKNKIIERTIRDKKMINIFLESFIIKYSNILIFVLNQISKTDQLFLNRIKRLAEDKHLIVVHNLKNFVNLEQVKYYVKNYLMNNLDFKLEELDYSSVFISDEEKNSNESGEKVMIYKEKEMFSSENKENEYYKNENKTKSVIHIIMANDGTSSGIKNSENSEAGRIYNEKVINIIRNYIITFTNIKSFDIIDKVVKHLKEKQKDLFQRTISDAGIIYQNNKIMFDEEIKKKSKFKGTLKRVIEDYLGNILFEGDVINPEYRDYLKKCKKSTEKDNDANEEEEEEEKDEYVIEFELPGKFEFENKKKESKDDKNEENNKKEDNKKYDKWDLKIGKKLKGTDMTYLIIISGEKKKPELKKKFENKRKFGKFKLIVYKKMDCFSLENEKDPIIKHKNGVHQYIWKVKYFKKKKPNETTLNKIDDKEKIKKKNTKKYEPRNSVILENNNEKDDENEEDEK